MIMETTQKIIEYIGSITNGVVTLNEQNARAIIDIVARYGITPTLSISSGTGTIELYEYSMVKSDYIHKRNIEKPDATLMEIKELLEHEKEVKELYKYVLKKGDLVLGIYYVASSHYT